jgi:hypothetical protein
VATRHKRPFGIRALSLLLLVLAGSLALDVWWGGLDFPWPAALGLPRAVTTRVLGSAFAVLLGLMAAGIWLLQRAAWVATMLAVGALMVLELRWYASGTPRYLLMALCVLIAFYLNLREVQALFGRGAGPAG